jgi:glycosyltransferase involved in cell wall biosynthesis
MEPSALTDALRARTPPDRPGELPPAPEQGATRALFVNEGGLGSGVLGHGALEATLEVGLATTSAVLPALVGVGQPHTRALRALSNLVPGLAPLDLDLQATRWHAVQALRTRQLVRREADRQPFDVLFVHSHSPAFGLEDVMRRVPAVLSVDVGVWAWRAMGIWQPVRRHSRAAMGLSLAAERRTLRAAALVVAWTPWSARSIGGAAGDTPVLVHHPGLDLERFQPTRIRTARRRSRVLFVGGRFETKGGHDLLAALDPLLGVDVELDVVTKDPLAPREGLRVHDLAPGDDALVSLYQQADVVCLPTHGDAVPWVVLEAMACGTPVVASRVGAIPDLLDDGRAGVLVARGDTTALRAALERVLGDDGLRARLAATARARCEERYDARVQGPALLERMRALARR